MKPKLANPPDLLADTAVENLLHLSDQPSGRRSGNQCENKESAAAQPTYNHGGSEGCQAVEQG